MTRNDDTTSSLDAFAQNKLAQLEARNQRRRLMESSRAGAMSMHVDGGPELISFTDNDYLGLSTHPDVISAARDAAAVFGAGAGASRLVTGNHPLYSKLEQTIARIKGTEDAVVYGSGYLANVGIIPTIIGQNDLIIADELIHTSIHGGVQLSKATVRFCRHNDVAHVRDILETERANFGRALIVVDGVYSMDGDIAPLKELGELAKAFDAWLMNDDAHALGTIGDGRGSLHAAGAHGLVPLQMGTLSKAAGAYGGYLAASRAVCDLMRTRSRSFIYTTGLPPAVVGAALKALEIIEADAKLVARPTKLAQHFANELGLAKPVTPIVPIVIGSETDALKASKDLADLGFKVIAFRPPTVPEGTSRLRFCFSASHRDHDVERLIAACKKLGLGNMS